MPPIYDEKFHQYKEFQKLYDFEDIDYQYGRKLTLFKIYLLQEAVNEFKKQIKINIETIKRFLKLK